MTLRTLLLGLAALPLIAGTPALAFSPGDLFSVPLPAQTRSEPRVLLAQASDPRVVGLEEQIRQLNGTIEELNFQILQMQEQIRKMQEDNEFRFQELEQKSGSAASPDRNTTSNSVAQAATPPATAAQQAATAAQPPASAPNAGAATRGEPPRDFGTITFDAAGNPTGAGVVPPAAPAAAATEGQQMAALPTASDADESYRNAYEFVLAGDYATAEAGFRDHIERFPGDKNAADARFWLGESLLGQNRYRDAAEVFLAANRDFPKSGKAPDMLLKLGVSLAAMNQRDIACATFAEIGQRYPGASGQLRERVSQEQKLAGC